jgi:hypothetical protein
MYGLSLGDPNFIYVTVYRPYRIPQTNKKQPNFTITFSFSKLKNAQNKFLKLTVLGFKQAF